MTGPVKFMIGKTGRIKHLPVDDLDVHQVEVHRVHVAGSVVDLPNFRVTIIDDLLGEPYRLMRHRGQTILEITGRPI